MIDVHDDSIMFAVSLIAVDNTPMPSTVWAISGPVSVGCVIAHMLSQTTTFDARRTTKSTKCKPLALCGANGRLQGTYEVKRLSRKLSTSI